MAILAYDDTMLREPRLLVPGMQPLGPVTASRHFGNVLMAFMATSTPGIAATVVGGTPFLLASNTIRQQSRRTPLGNVCIAPASGSSSLSDGFYHGQNTRGKKSLTVCFTVNRFVASGSLANLWHTGSSNAELGSPANTVASCSFLLLDDSKLHWGFYEGTWDRVSGNVAHGIAVNKQSTGVVVWRGGNIVEYYLNGKQVSISNVTETTTGAGLASRSFDGCLATTWGNDNGVVSSFVFDAAWPKGLAEAVSLNPHQFLIPA